MAGMMAPGMVLKDHCRKGGYRIYSDPNERGVSVLRKVLAVSGIVLIVSTAVAADYKPLAPLKLTKCQVEDGAESPPRVEVTLGGDKKAENARDSLVGGWDLAIPAGMDKVPEKAAHLVVTKNAKGELEGSLLWRWGSPEKVLSITVDGNRFSIVHPWSFRFEGVIDGDRMLGRAVSTDPRDSIGRVGDGIVGHRSPSVPNASVKDAKFGEPIDLLGNGMSDWETLPGNDENRWSFKGGVLSNRVKRNDKGEWAGGGLNLVTKRRDFTDFRLSYDVRVPKGANSGVYLRGRYEIQTVDSYGKKPDPCSMGAYYGRVAPCAAAEKPAGVWQHVDVTLYKYHLTVVLNGVTIIDNAPITGLTGGALDADEAKPGPIYVQGDHSDADYRNMVLRPVCSSGI